MLKRTNPPIIKPTPPSLATLDAGLKSMATEQGPPKVLRGAVEGSVTRFFGDEHSALTVPEGQQAPALGDVVVLKPPHCDPTVNMCVYARSGVLAMLSCDFALFPTFLGGEGGERGG